MSCSKLENSRIFFFFFFLIKLYKYLPGICCMNNLDRFKYLILMTSKDYDLNVLCISFICELYNERNVLDNNRLNNNLCC